MSVANIFCQGSHGYLLADRGYFHADGRLAFTARKALELPQFGAAIVARGHLRAREQIARGIREAAPSTIAHLLADMPAILLDAMTREARVSPAEDAGTLSTHLSIVYMHPISGRAAGALIGTDRNGMPGWYEPFSLIAVTEATQPGVDLAVACGRVVNASDPACFEVARDGLSVMEWQRRDVWTFNGLPTGHHAAGGVDLTTISAAGVSTVALRRWHDRIGHPVTPASET